MMDGWMCSFGSNNTVTECATFLSILNSYFPYTNGLSYENTQRGNQNILLAAVFLSPLGNVVFAVRAIPLAQAYICEDSFQLNKAANDTYQNNACQKLAENEKLTAKSFISSCDVNRLKQG